jgi:hypothetical protein
MVRGGQFDFLSGRYVMELFSPSRLDYRTQSAEPGLRTAASALVDNINFNGSSPLVDQAHHFSTNSEIDSCPLSSCITKCEASDPERGG